METRRNMFLLPSSVDFFPPLSSYYFLSWPSDELVTVSWAWPCLCLVTAAAEEAGVESGLVSFLYSCQPVSSLGIPGSEDAELLSAQTEMSWIKSENKAVRFVGVSTHTCSLQTFKTEQKVEDWSQRSFERNYLLLANSTFL